MKKNTGKILIILCICILNSIIIVLMLNHKSFLIKNNDILHSINVKGYDLNQKFNSNIYEYEVVVDNDIIEIICDTKTNIMGCNVTLDLTNQDNFTHKIITSNSGEKKNM